MFWPFPLAMNDVNRLVLWPATFIQLWAGRRFYEAAWRAIRHGFGTNMSTLVAVGTSAAWAYSVVVTLFPEVVVRAGLRPETYFDSSTIIVGLILLGRWLEARAKGRTTGAIRRLVGLQAKTARLVTAAGDLDVPIDQVQPGDLLRVRPGEKVPTDGVLTEGSSALDEAMLTGEAMPVAKGPGDEVIGGNPERHRQLRHARDAGRARHGAGPDRRARPAGAGLEGADPAPRRPDQRDLRPGRPRGRCPHVRVWWLLGPEPKRPWRWPSVHQRRDHRLPVRHGPRDADGDHGRHRSRRRGRDPDPRRRSLGDSAQGDHGRVRQDRHAHARHARGGGPRPGPRAATRSRSSGWPRPSRPASEHPLASAILLAARERGLAFPGADEFAAIVGGAEATVDGVPVLVGSARLLGERGIDLGPLGATGDAQAGQGRTPVFVAPRRRRGRADHDR